MEWRDKYTPKSLKEYVFIDDMQKKQFEHWAKTNSLPDILLLAGNQGMGKSSMATVIMNEFKIHPIDYKKINVGRNRGVDMIDEVDLFCRQGPRGSYYEGGNWSDIQLVLLDEVEQLTEVAAVSLKGLLESYPGRVKFILTSNFPKTLSKAVLSRCTTYIYNTLDLEQFACRVATILSLENIEFTDTTLMNYVNLTYPDLRDCIKEVERNSITGVLI